LKRGRLDQQQLAGGKQIAMHAFLIRGSRLDDAMIKMWRNTSSSLYSSQFFLSSGLSSSQYVIWEISGFFLSSSQSVISEISKFFSFF
jgi:hypothetical protein